MPKTVEPTRSDDKSIVSLKVALRGTRPPVWRRLLMPGTMTLADLHQALQAAMGWEDCHLHVFDIAGRQYGGRHAGDDVDEKRPTLNSLVKAGVARFTYTYDFGDNLGTYRCHRKTTTATRANLISNLRRREAQLSTRGLRRPLGL